MIRPHSASFHRRLPGFAFEAGAPQGLGELPRMDVALFAGFAACGPVGVPVAVEDAQQFADVFGADAPLAWDASHGRMAVAQLGGAVRLFFANGGRRCWVLRLARGATTSALPVPGVMCIDAQGHAAPLQLAARSPGRWADALTLASSVSAARCGFVRWLPGAGAAKPPAGAELQLGGATELLAGDLLRLAWPASGREWHAAVASVDAVGLPGHANRRRVRVFFADGVVALDLQRAPHATSGIATWAGGSAGAELLAAGIDSPPSLGPSIALRLELPAHRAPAAGETMAVGFGDDELLFCVAQADAAARPSGSPPDGDGVVLHGLGRWRAAAGAAPAEAPSVERLRLALWARDGDGARQRIDELGLGPAHARHPQRLPGDDTLHRTPDAEALAPWADVLAPRAPVAGGGVPGLCLPLGVGTLPGPALVARHDDAAPLQRDGLVPFDAALFGDPDLLATPSTTLVEDAEFLRMRAGTPLRELRGLHAALVVEEASLIAVPDAVQPGWLSDERGAPVPPEEPDEATPDPRDDDFVDCGSIPGPAPRLFAEALGGNAVRLHWLAEPTVDGPFQVEEARRRDGSDAAVAWQGDDTAAVLAGRPSGDAYYRVRGVGGPGTPWSKGVVVRLGGGGADWRMRRADEFADDTLRAVHRLLLRLAAARGDALALLSLPAHYREDDALAHRGRIESGVLAGSPDEQVLPLGGLEALAFDHAALYHGWLHGRDPDGTWRPMVPDGAAAGLIARRALARGAWVAPANEPLRGVVALERPAPSARWRELMDAQVNVIRHEARGFLPLSADTLARDDDLRPIGVRRLLTLLRRAATRAGATWMFEPNDDSLRRGVERHFEAILGDLFRRGAFAGATAPSAFQVVADRSLNTRASMDAGRFIVELRVAPSRPMSFLTIRLTQSGDRLVASGA